MKLSTRTTAFTRAETYSKAVVVAVATGAAAAVGQLIINSEDQMALFIPAGMGQHKHAFFAGAVRSLTGSFTKTPLTPKSPSKQAMLESAAGDLGPLLTIWPHPFGMGPFAIE